MSTRDGGGQSSASAPVDLSSDSESRSSYAGSGESGPSNSNCRWRTTRFHDQECSRYFDCPSHIVERALSQSEEEGHEDEDQQNAQEQEQVRPERREQEDADMADPDEHPSGPGTVSPVSEDSGSSGGGSHEAVSPLPDVPAASDAGSPASDNEDEVEITGSRNISREVQVNRPSASRRAASGTAENPIDLRDDSPPQTPVRQQPRYPDRELPPSPPSPPSPPPRSLVTGEPDLVDPLLPTRFGGSYPFPDRPPRAPRSPDFVLPRWQPDAEVTYCPICRTQFSMWVRKHHCRKCGRVVCNRCSPHRITIPYQYIVQPPGTPQQRYPSYQDSPDLSIVGGGERVRLCNPCVPDPNIAPPQQAQGAHSRSQSSLVVPSTTNDAGPSFNRQSSYFGGSTLSDLPARSRSATMQHAGPSRSMGASSNVIDVVALADRIALANRAALGGPPAMPYGSFGRTSHFRRPYEPLRSDNSGGSSSRAGPSSSAGLRPALAIEPLAEEDECPVCHRELPPRNLQDFEALREAHIKICITTHSSYGGSIPADANTPGPDSMRFPMHRTRLTGMFPYTATEKDCVDSAECTICLEEFEVGVPMARLECLCRFHRVCISAWWEKNPGRCPVHQHDGFGY